MSVGDTLRFITSHPLNHDHRMQALFRYAKWQVGSRLVPGPVLFEWVGGTRVIVRPGERGMTQNVYCGLQEFADMGYLLQLLTPEDLFIDVGANAGSYTVLACGARGARGYCFEPVPSTFARLSENLLINRLMNRVAAMNVGIGNSEGELMFTSRKDTTNHVLSVQEQSADRISVPVRTLDSILTNQSPTFIKIDVEGFETAVLTGAGETLLNPSLHSILIELNGAGRRYGYDEESIVRELVGYGFTPCEYDPLTRELVPLPGKNLARDNTLFVRGMRDIQDRLKSAPRISAGFRDF